MLENVQENQDGAFIRIPKELDAHAGDRFDVVANKATGVVMLYPISHHQEMAQVGELTDLFKDWQGLYEPAVDEWLEHGEL